MILHETHLSIINSYSKIDPWISSLKHLKNSVFPKFQQYLLGMDTHLDILVTIIVSTCHITYIMAGIQSTLKLRFFH